MLSIANEIKGMKKEEKDGRAGSAVAWETLANDAMARGQVVAPFEGRLETGAAYWLVAKDHSAKAGDVAKFAEWLRAELGKSFEMA